MRLPFVNSSASILKLGSDSVVHGLSVDCAEVSSPHGHDSFLLQPPGYHERIAAFLSDDA